MYFFRLEVHERTRLGKSFPNMYNTHMLQLINYPIKRLVHIVELFDKRM